MGLDLKHDTSILGQTPGQFPILLSSSEVWFGPGQTAGRICCGVHACLHKLLVLWFFLLHNPPEEAKHPSKCGMREDKERERDVGRYLSQVITRFVQFDRNVLAA